jgi:hypothetical protein
MSAPDGRLSVWRLPAQLRAPSFAGCGIARSQCTRFGVGSAASYHVCDISPFGCWMCLGRSPVLLLQVPKGVICLV